MLKILLMEDDPDFVKVAVEVLTSADHQVVSCASAREALELLDEQQFDLLITDIIIRKDMEPVADGGLLLISRLRGPVARHLDEWKRKMPIIAISGAIHNRGMSHLLEISRNLGADITMAKPTNMDELLQNVRVLTRK